MGSCLIWKPNLVQTNANKLLHMIYEEFVLSLLWACDIRRPIAMPLPPSLSRQTRPWVLVTELGARELGIPARGTLLIEIMHRVCIDNTRECNTHICNDSSNFSAKVERWPNDLSWPQIYVLLMGAVRLLHGLKVSPYVNPWWIENDDGKFGRWPITIYTLQIKRYEAVYTLAF